MGRPREFDTDIALSQAVDVFWERGYTEASVQDLCKAMNINSGSLYAAFGTKQDIFHKSVKHYLAMVARDGFSRITSHGTGADGIRAYFDYVVDGILTGKRCNGCLGTNSFMEVSDNDDLIKQMMNDHFALLEDIFLQVLTGDGYANAEGISHYLVCFAQGLNVVARTKPDAETLDRIVSTALICLEAKAA